VFCGAGLNWAPSDRERSFEVNPNMYIFWQDKQVKKFDAKTKSEKDEPASTYLGTELNVFAHYYVFKDLKLFCISSLFIPGSHFVDIQGKPLSSDQDKALDSVDPTGFDRDRIPNIGHDVAYTFNLGLQFKF
jgi:hypothetical protein